MNRSTAQIPTQRLIEVAADIAKGIYAALAEIGVARVKTRKVKMLWALSDADLATRGIERKDIIRLVLADVI